MRNSISAQSRFGAAGAGMHFKIAVTRVRFAGQQTFKFLLAGNLMQRRQRRLRFGLRAEQEVVVAVNPAVLARKGIRSDESKTAQHLQYQWHQMQWRDPPRQS